MTRRHLRLLSYAAAAACFGLAAGSPYLLPGRAWSFAAVAFMLAGVTLLVVAAAGVWPPR
jgi:hypothetical protein